MGDPVYVDTSALVKLALNEPESPELDAFLLDAPLQMVSSEIGDIELVRAIRRADPRKLDAALEILTRTVLLPMSTSIRVKAGQVDPTGLRSLDAVHLATALEIQSDLVALVTYDRRLAQAGSDSGLRVMSPGQQIAF